MNIKIDLLKNHPDCIQRLAEIWCEVLGKIWLPDITIEMVAQKLINEHLNDDILPITYVAFDDARPIGRCSLRLNDGIRPDLMPWLGSLVVDQLYQNQGVGKALIDAVKIKAKELGYKKLFLFALDSTIPIYYSRLGWNTIGMDEFKGHPVTIMEASL